MLLLLCLAEMLLWVWPGKPVWDSVVLPVCRPPGPGSDRTGLAGQQWPDCVHNCLANCPTQHRYGLAAGWVRDISQGETAPDKVGRSGYDKEYSITVLGVLLVHRRWKNRLLSYTGVGVWSGWRSSYYKYTAILYEDFQKETVHFYQMNPCVMEL